MSLPNDFNDPFYNRLKNEVRAMLAGALGTTVFGEQNALNKVRQSLQAEHGFSDALVKSMPEWQARYPQPTVEPIHTISDNMVNNTKLPNKQTEELPLQKEK